MSGSGLVPCLAVLLLQLWGVHTLATTSACRAPCLCQKTPLLNCSSSGLSKAPSQIPETATGLDLSHNALQSLFPLGSGRVRLKGLLHFWVGDNALETLSLCFGKGVKGNKTLSGRQERCVAWAPDLQMLSAERNQLKQIPGGLGSVKSLQVLQLSHNRISELGPADFAGCTYLKELHLQHNLINTIHPQAFRDLSNLQVLDLSYNLLTHIPLPAYLSLRNLNTFVAISGNRWRCDCNLKTIRRWLSFDNELGNPGWNVLCFSPSHHAGKDLLHLEESDLTCPQPVYSTPGLTKELTVEEGGELLLSCAAVTQDFMQSRWWTPYGQVSEDQQVLLISNITEQHAGLYVCVSGFQEEHVSIFNLHVHKRVHDTRLRRAAQNVLDERTREENVNLQRNVRAVQQNQFVLPVCLSVFITFIVAFVLGVLLRPLLDKLCKKIRSKRDSSSSTNSQTASTRPRPYVNEGYSDTDDHVQEVRVGSRVTFGGVTEVKDSGGNIPYYVTVEDGNSESSSEHNTDVEISQTHCVEIQDLKSREGSDPSSSLQISKEVPLRKENLKPTVGYPKAESTKIMEFEPIPDQEDSIELEERSISPVSSHSELPQELESSCDEKEPIEQSVDPPVVTVHEDKEGNTDQKATVQEFMTDPLSGLREDNVDDLDPDLWNDSGESFSFTDESPRSSSRVTQIAVLDYPLFEGKEMSVDKQSDKGSSCNSSESGLTEEEQTEYTVNPKEDEESETYGPHSENDDLNENKLSPLEQGTLTDKPNMGADFRQDTITVDPSDVYMTFTRGESFDDGLFTDQNEGSDSSKTVHISEEEPKQYHVHPVYRNSRSKIDRPSASSSDEDEEAEDAYYPRKLEIKTEHEVHSECVIPVKNPNSTLNINFDNSSSSTDVEERTNKDGEKKSFKRLSGLSSLLFNRNGTETDKKAVQTPPKTTSKDSKKVGGFLGLSFNKPTVVPENDDKPNTNDESFFGTIGQAFDRLPKLKKSLMFSVSDPEPTIQHGHTPVVEAGCDSKTSHQNPSEESLFKTTDVSLYPVPKVKRYLQFSLSDPQPSGLIPSSIKTGGVTPDLETQMQSRKSDSSSEDELSPITNGDSFFGKIGPSLDGIPKVKRYIQFTQSEPQPTAQSPSISLKQESFIPVLGTKTQSLRSESSSEGELSPASKGDNFFTEIGTSLDGVPKVKRYIQFTQSEPQHLAQTPPTTLKTESIIPVLGTKTESVRSESSSEDELSPASKGDNFFGQIGTYLDEVPKVKRYIQFTQSEPMPTAQSPSISLKQESFIPVLGTKTQSLRSESSSEGELSPASTGDNFFTEIGTSLDEVPKVKRYIQFTQSEPQHLAQTPPTTLKQESFIPVLGTKTQSLRSESSSEGELSPDSTGDNFFTEIGTSLDEVPKVTRYIQFTQSEPRTTAQSPSISLKQESFIPVLGTKTQSLRSESSSEGELSPASKRDNFFTEIGTSLDEVPKVKRYIQFTQSEPQHVAQTPPTTLKQGSFIPVLGTKTQSLRSESSSEDKLSPASTGDNFFAEIGTSLDEVPKVKRYIQFTQSEPPTTAHSPSISLKQESFIPVLGTKTESVRYETSSEDELSPTSKGDDFFPEIGTSLDEVPKVKRYIQFTQSEPQPSAQSTSAQSWVTPELETKVQSGNQLSSPMHSENFFGKISPSLDRVPKIKRYIQFTYSEPQPSSQSLSTALKTESFIPVLGTETQPVRSESSSEDELSPTSNGDSFFRGIGTSLDGVPKVRRYIQFTQSEHQPSAQTPPTTLKTENYIPVFGTKTESVRSASSFAEELSPTSKSDSYFEQVGTRFEGVPKVKRYIRFTQFEPQPSTQSPSSSLRTESFIPVLGTKTESMRSESSCEDEFSPATKEDKFFEQVGTPFEGVPKVKRYIEFNIQSEPQPSAQSTSVKSWVTPELETELQSGISDVSSENQLSPPMNKENFFGQISLDKVPKVNRYIQFTYSEPQSSGLLPSSIKTERVTEVKAGKNDLASENELSSPTKGETFFGDIGTSLEGVPKVKRYIQFTQLEPQSSGQIPSTSLKSERVTPILVPKIQSERSDPPSEVELSTISRSFIGKIDGVPKLKRYIQFTQSEPLSQTMSPSNEPIIHRGMMININSSSEDGVKADADEHSFLGQTGTSLDKIPKVKRYIQFTQSPSQHSTQPSSQYLEKQITTPELLKKTELLRSSSSPDDVKPINKDLSLYEIPKVKRYIQFTQSESHPSDCTNDNGAKPNDNKANFFEGMYVPPEHIPKVKRSLQFIQTDPKLENQFSPLLTKEGVTTELVTKTESITSTYSPHEDVRPNNQDNFFDQTQTSFGVLPKVNRHIQFSQTDVCSPNQSNVNTHEVMITESRRSKAESDTKSASNGQNFFENVDVSVNQIPKLSRYLKFTHSNLSAQSPSGSGSLSGEEFRTTTTGNSFLQIDTSLDEVPKVKRYIQFTQSEPQILSPQHPSNKTTGQQTELRQSLLAFRRENVEDSFFKQINVSFDQLPKVKRYVRFTRSESYPSTQMPSSLSSPLRVTPVLRRHSLSTEDELQFTREEEDFFGQMGAYLPPDGVPRVTRYIQFTQSKRHTPTPISKVLDRRVESIDSEVNLTIKDDVEDFSIGQTSVSFGTLQRPKTSLSFTTDPQNQDQTQSLSSMRGSSFDMKVATETSRLEQPSRPKRTLFLPSSDAYGHLHRPFTSHQPGLSTQESIESRLSSSGPSLSTESRDPSTLKSRSELDTELGPRLRRSLGTDISLQDENKTTKETRPSSLGRDDAREYLRDSSQARQRQERRRLLFQQKRKAMDGFSLTSSTSQEMDNYEDTTIPHSEHSASSASTGPASHMDIHVSGLKGLSAKRISSLKYKSAMQGGTYKYHSDV